MAESTGSDAAQPGFDLAVLSDAGTDRPDNEDACGHFIEGPQAALFVVADGIGGYEGGEIASRMAVDIRSRLTAKARPHGARPGGCIAPCSAPISRFTTVRSRCPSCAGWGPH